MSNMVPIKDKKVDFVIIVEKFVVDMSEGVRILPKLMNRCFKKNINKMN